MEKNEIVEKLTSVFREVFNDATITLRDEMTSNDVDNWDSLSHMLMITRVETLFGVKFRLKELNMLKKVGDIVSLLIEKTSGV